MTTTQRGIITLLKSAVTGEALLLPEDLDLKEVAEFARKQSLQALVYQGACNCGIDRESETMQRLFLAYYNLLIRHEKQMRALTRLFTVFEEQAIDYLPLKGVNLKKLYPNPEMRTMGDADILIRQNQYDKISGVLDGLGYRLTNVDEQVYTWDSDQLHLEIHQYPVNPAMPHASYYGTGWQLAQLAEGHRYRMSPEDEFVFIFEHFARHYQIGGIGCRHVLDLYVHKRAYPHLDEHYLEQEFEKLNLLKFYWNIRVLLRVWFEDAEGDEKTDLITEYIFSGGTFGSEKNRKYYFEVIEPTMDQPEKVSRGKVFLRAAFPSLDYARKRYPILNKAPWLLPVIWVVRFLRNLLKVKKIREKVTFLGTVSEEDVDSLRKTLERTGIELDP